MLHKQQMYSVTIGLVKCLFLLCLIISSKIDVKAFSTERRLAEMVIHLSLLGHQSAMLPSAVWSKFSNVRQAYLNGTGLQESGTKMLNAIEALAGSKWIGKEHLKQAMSANAVGHLMMREMEALHLWWGPRDEQAAEQFYDTALVSIEQTVQDGTTFAVACQNIQTQQQRTFVATMETNNFLRCCF